MAAMAAAALQCHQRNIAVVAVERSIFVTFTAMEYVKVRRITSAGFVSDKPVQAILISIVKGY